MSTVNIKRAGGVAEYSGRAHTDGTSVQAGDNSLIPPSVQWTVSWVPGLALASRHQTTSTSAAATQRKWSVCFVVEVWTCRWFLVRLNVTRYTIPQYLCIHSHVRLDFSSPVSWQKACVAKWLRPKRRCKCDTVDAVKRNFGLILPNDGFGIGFIIVFFCFLWIFPLDH